MTRIILPALLCGFVLLAPGFAHAFSKDDLRTVTVSGTGAVTSPADTAQITVGVISEDDTARKALDENIDAMSKVVDELKKQGIAAKDIQTVNFSVNPRYQQAKNGKKPKIVGYRVTNTVNITVRKLSRLGDILDQVVTSGSNQIGGVRFSVEEPSKLQDEARKEAMKDGIRKAKLLAKAANASLGKVLKIHENYGAQPRPRQMYTRMEAGARDVPIQPGEQTLRAQVTVTWELN